MTNSDDDLGWDDDPEEAALEAHRSEVEAKLVALTAMRLWDYEWMEAPRPGEAAPYVLALAGGTDLAYHHFVRVVFRGVRHSTLPQAFHHPRFELASRTDESRLRQMADFGPRTVAIRVVMEADSPLEETAFVAADDVEVIRAADGGPIREPYLGSKPENVQWWWPR
jgi:hypothetical protein